MPLNDEELIDFFPHGGVSVEENIEEEDEQTKDAKSILGQIRSGDIGYSDETLIQTKEHDIRKEAKKSAEDHENTLIRNVISGTKSFGNQGAAMFYSMHRPVISDMERRQREDDIMNGRHVSDAEYDLGARQAEFRANEFAHRVNELSQVANIADAYAGDNEKLGEVIRSVTQSVELMASASLLTGTTPGVITAFGAFAANGNYQEARMAGKSEEEALSYGAVGGVLEAGITALGYKAAKTLGVVDFESLEFLKGGARVGLMKGLAKVGVGTLGEVGEENAIEISNAIASAVMDIDPEAMSAENLKRTVEMTTYSTVATMGLYSGVAGGVNASRGGFNKLADAKESFEIDKAIDQIQDPENKNAAIASKQLTDIAKLDPNKVSRRKLAKAMGVSQGELKDMSQDDRRDIVMKARGALDEVGLQEDTQEAPEIAPIEQNEQETAEAIPEADQLVKDAGEAIKAEIKSEDDTFTPEVQEKLNKASFEWDNGDRPAPEQVVPSFPTNKVISAPDKLQYKEENREADGSTQSLKHVTNPNQFKRLAFGVPRAWYNKEEDTVYIVDGHNRLAKAKELGIENIPLQFIEANSFEEARSQGALLNMQEGHGTVIDAAKFLRDSGQDLQFLEDEGVKLTDSVAGKGLALSKLHDDIFTRIINQDMSPNEGIIVAQAIPDPDKQIAFIREVDQDVAENGSIDQGVLKQWAEGFNTEDFVEETQVELFGKRTEKVSIERQKAEVKNDFIKALRKDKRVFGNTADNAKVLEAAGNVLNTEENKNLADDAKAALNLFNTFKDLQGPLGDLIRETAITLKKGTKNEKIEARKNFYTQAKAILPTLVQGRGKASTTDTESSTNREPDADGQIPDGPIDQNQAGLFDAPQEAKALPPEPKPKSKGKATKTKKELTDVEKYDLQTEREAKEKAERKIKMDKVKNTEFNEDTLDESFVRSSDGSIVELHHVREGSNTKATVRVVDPKTKEVKQQNFYIEEDDAKTQFESMIVKEPKKSNGKKTTDQESGPESPVVDTTQEAVKKINELAGRFFRGEKAKTKKVDEKTQVLMGGELLVEVDGNATIPAIKNAIAEKYRELIKAGADVTIPKNILEMDRNQFAVARELTGVFGQVEFEVDALPATNSDGVFVVDNDQIFDALVKQAKSKEIDEIITDNLLSDMQAEDRKEFGPDNLPKDAGVVRIPFAGKKSNGKKAPTPKNPIAEKHQEFAEAVEASRVNPETLRKKENTKKIEQLKNEITRVHKHLPNTKEFAVAREVLRLHREVEANAQRKADEYLTAILNPLEDNIDDKILFEYYVMMRNVVESIESGELASYGIESLEQAEEILADLQKQVDANPKVQKAVDRMRKLFDDLAGKMKALSIINEEVDKEHYIHHQIGHYLMVDTPGNRRRAVERIQAGFSKRRLQVREDGDLSRDSKYDPNIEFIGAQREFLTDAFRRIGAEKSIADIKKTYDVKPELKEKAKLANDIAFVGGLFQYNILQSLKREHAILKQKQASAKGNSKRSKAEKNDPFTKQDREEMSELYQQMIEIDPRIEISNRIAQGFADVRSEFDDGNIDLSQNTHFKPMLNRMDENTVFEDSMWPLLSWLARGTDPNAYSQEATDAARMIFSGIQEKDNMTREKLGNNYKSWETLAREDESLAIWQPEQGNVFFKAFTIPEKLLEEAQKLINDKLNNDPDWEAFAALGSDILENSSTAIAMGGPKEQIVIPAELAEQLDSLKSDTEDKIHQILARKATSTWKKHILNNPFTAIPYNLRNMMGDLDAAIAGNPDVLKFTIPAMKEMWGVAKREIDPSKNFIEAQDIGVFSSSNIFADIYDASKQKEYRSFFKHLKSHQWTMRNAPYRVWEMYNHLIIDKVAGGREGVLRYAAYLSYKEQLMIKDGSILNLVKKEKEKALSDTLNAKMHDGFLFNSNLKNKSWDDFSETERAEKINKHYNKVDKNFREKIEKGAKINYGASKKSDVDLIQKQLGLNSAAAHLARNLLGDYNNVTAFGDSMRKNIVPFWAFTELNFRRYKQIAKNAFAEGKGRGAQVGAQIGFKMFIRLSAMNMMMSAWNHLAFGDEEDELSEWDRNNPHLILWSFDDNTTVILRNSSALGELLAWVGGYDLIDDALTGFKSVRDGQEDPTDILKGIGSDGFKKLIGSGGPVVKGGAELVTGQSWFPDPSNPREKPRDELFFSQWGVEPLYRSVKESIAKRGDSFAPHQVARSLAGITNSKNNALNEMYRLINLYSDQNGVDVKSGNHGLSKSRFLKNALKNNDKKAFKRALEVHLEDGKGLDNFIGTMDKIDPINLLGKNSGDREKFYEFTTGKQTQTVEDARLYAQQLREKGYKWYNEAINEMPKKQLNEYRMERATKIISVSSPLNRKEPRISEDPEKYMKWKRDQEDALNKLRELGVTSTEFNNSIRFYNRTRKDGQNKKSKDFEKTVGRQIRVLDFKRDNGEIN